MATADAPSPFTIVTSLGIIGVRREISTLLSDESQRREDYLEEARLSHHLLSVSARDDEVRARVLKVLDTHGAHHIRYLGRLTVEDLG